MYFILACFLLSEMSDRNGGGRFQFKNLLKIRVINVSNFTHVNTVRFEKRIILMHRVKTYILI